MTKPLLDQAVDRFLAWELPEDFRPDGGISFDPHRLGTPRLCPTGTNLLDGIQAAAMLAHVVGPLLTSLQAERDQAVRDAERSAERERDRIINLLIDDKRFNLWLPEAGDLYPASAKDLRKMFGE